MEKFDHMAVYTNSVRIYRQFGWIYEPSLDIPKLHKISPLALRNFAYLADMRFSSVTQMPSAPRISAVPLGETAN